ncbi:AAA family ATPase [Paraglaciecola chathamensis]|uniref:Exodeoxyribonuclease V alpha subunit n=1 Tax=Paraglaciecola chathamensis S18K6 TaxID=1127672 RepID=A0AAV3UWG4_9ALTE|nr:AAA family ATPase [Paraglaciecola chathamensis]GAC09466.1 exodeoxyribonuclease V alpha subunit [Paraglaciecola chathamensis S18K6]
MSVFDGELQIRKIRRRGGIGGVIFSAVAVGSNQRFVVKANHQIARSPSLFKEMHIWHVKGQVEQTPIKWKDGTTAIEKTITPTKMDFVKAAHENLKRLLAESPDFKGISEIKAEKLVTFFGDTLYDIARNKDIKRLLPIVGQEVAQRIIDGLNQYEKLGALRLLDELGVPPHIGDSVITIWEHQAYEQIRKNPYFLTAFMADLSAIDAYALDRLKMKDDAPERLIAYAKQVMFNGFNSGNTCLETSKVKYQLNRMLGKALGTKAFDEAVEQGELEFHDNLVQVKSMDIVESSVANIIKHLSEQSFSQALAKRVDSVIDTFELGVGFSLTEQQRNAVLQCCTHSIALLTGGAGCGKTTVIEAICYTLESLNQTKQVILMALAGKAAQRITEATGREAMTIAGFMHNVKPEDIDNDAVIIVDEASMVDILSLLKVLKRVPKRGRIILTGDQEQLSPVGVGLGLHVLVNLHLPNPHLTVVKRQSESSGIPNIASTIRNYPSNKIEVPFTPYQGLGSGVSFIDCEPSNIEATCMKVYRELGGDGSNDSVVLLSSVKHQEGGVVNLNSHVYDEFALGEKLTLEHTEFGNVNHNIDGRPLKVGEMVMFTRNDYKKDIRNGSVGKVLSFGDEDVIIDFEGNIVVLALNDLVNIERAYAMTVHKSQGSQYERVIVVIKNSRNIDRHLLYTAATRAKKQAIFVGCRCTFYSALLKSNALNRRTLLHNHFERVADNR